MTKKELTIIASKIQVLDEQISTMFAKREELQKGLTIEERNKLFELVEKDGKPHYC